MKRHSFMNKKFFFSELTVIFPTNNFGLDEKYITFKTSTPIPMRIPISIPIIKHATNVTKKGIKSISETKNKLYETVYESPNMWKSLHLEHYNSKITHWLFFMKWECLFYCLKSWLVLNLFYLIICWWLKELTVDPPYMLGHHNFHHKDNGTNNNRSQCWFWNKREVWG